VFLSGKHHYLGARTPIAARRLVGEVDEPDVTCAPAQVDGTGALTRPQDVTNLKILSSTVSKDNVHIMDPHRAVGRAQLHLAVAAMTIGSHAVAFSEVADHT
jgi:hypothetical protein